jgi:hypothetical protein
MRMRRRVRWVVLALCLAAASAARGDEPRPWMLSVEVLSQIDPVPPKIARATYAQKEAFTRETLAATVPEILALMNVPRAALNARVSPGGYRDAIAPAIQGEAKLAEAEARRLAAALGYVFVQWSVLIADYGAEGGAVSYFTLRYPRGALTTARAEAAFAGLRRNLASDKLGFSSFGDRMIFLNLETGIGDAAFLTGLRRLHMAGVPLSVTIDGPGKAKAHFVGNDWDKARGGEGYEAIVGAEGKRTIAALRWIRAKHAAAVVRAAQRYGWQ